MFANYRPILLALCWVILVGVAPLPPDERGNGQQTQPEQGLPEPTPPEPPPFQEANETNELYDPCGKGEENRKSDLCAQWKAADAAKESADWTRRSYWLIFAGTVVGAFTLFAAIAAALYAREAAKHTETGSIQTERSAKAAEDAVAVTRDIGQAQVRAYLAIEDPKITARTDSNCLMISFHVRNLGNSPAKEFNYAYLISLYRVPMPGDEFPPKTYSRENTPQYPNFPGNGNRRIKTGGLEVINHLASDFRFTDEEIGYFRENSLWVEISLATRFKDVFGATIAEIEHFHRLGGFPLDSEVKVHPIGYSRHPMAGLALQ